MDALATRVWGYQDERGHDAELTLTVFVPFEAEPEMWKCGFVFGPPITRAVTYGAGADALQALLGCLEVARGYLESTPLGDRARWRGAQDCGLPWPAERPASSGPANIPLPVGDCPPRDILATRVVRYPDDSGNEKTLLLTVFMPFEAEDRTWRCGFTFGPPLDTSVRHGTGADFIEALLDSVATARATFEETAPKDWSRSGRSYDLGDLPYKAGKSFWTDPAGEIPGMPEFFSSAPESSPGS